MSDNESTLKNLEEKEKALAENHVGEQRTEVKATFNEEEEISEITTETKVRHDVVK